MTFAKTDSTQREPILLPTEYSLLCMEGKRLVREMYMYKQKNLCYHCEHSLSLGPPESITDMKITPELYPDGFFPHPIHLHHDHETDMTIGAVHAYCNAVLWEYHGE